MFRTYCFSSLRSHSFTVRALVIKMVEDSFGARQLSLFLFFFAVLPRLEVTGSEDFSICPFFDFGDAISLVLTFISQFIHRFDYMRPILCVKAPFLT